MAKSIFQFLANCRQLLKNNHLDIAICKTTVGGYLYDLGRIALDRNAKEEMCVQNKNIGFVFGTLWRRFGPITLKLPGEKLQLICFYMV